MCAIAYLITLDRPQTNKTIKLQNKIKKLTFLLLTVFVYKRKTRRDHHSHSIDPVDVEECQAIDTKESLCPDSHQEEMKEGDTEVSLISGVSEV